MWLSGEESIWNSEDSFDPCIMKISRRRAWQPPPVFLTGEFHVQRSLGGYSPGVAELDTTEATEHARMHIDTFFLKIFFFILVYTFYFFNINMPHFDLKSFSDLKQIRLQLLLCIFLAFS